MADWPPTWARSTRSFQASSPASTPRATSSGYVGSRRAQARGAWAGQSAGSKSKASGSTHC
eukprot:6555666-Lingulodinium_polyedra.AAC.1